MFVALCALPDPDPTLAPGASPKPGPCTVGGEGAATWVSSNPPEHGRDLAVPYGDGGSFTTELEVRAVIDADHDCRKVGCALVTRNDDTNPADRTQDLYLPVAFAAESTEQADSAAADAASASRAASDDDSSGSAAPVVIGVVAAVALAGGAGTFLVRRRRGTPA